MCIRDRLSRPEMERQGHLHSAAEWISLARQMQKSGTLFLLLTGGEPLPYSFRQDGRLKDMTLMGGSKNIGYSFRFAYADDTEVSE